ncbi:hypothetical protein [Nocardia niwae]|uniref:hypothetical protein n=1 Tax=Nocardia niwae TaxID=626084 RepID=UPI0007A55801|nr:hypothetical protein [Nocardia niwae]
MTGRDIVDEIDALITTQLDAGEPETGYDYDDPTYPQCPHPWCSETWHGLAITQRMREMRWRGVIDGDYRYDEDDSTILCPGSLFEGEFQPPIPEPIIRHWVRNYDGDLVPWTELTEAQALRTILAWSNPFLPDISDQVDGILSPLTALEQLPPRWWRCDDISELEVTLTSTDETDDFTAPTRIIRRHHTLTVNGERIELVDDPNEQFGTCVQYGFEPDSRTWVEAHCRNRPRVGDWYARDEQPEPVAEETSGDGYARTSTTERVGGPIEGPPPFVASDSIPFVVNAGEAQLFTAGNWQPLGFIRDVELSPDPALIEAWGPDTTEDAA